MFLLIATNVRAIDTPVYGMNQTILGNLVIDGYITARGATLSITPLSVANGGIGTTTFAWNAIPFGGQDPDAPSGLQTDVANLSWDNVLKVLSTYLMKLLGVPVAPTCDATTMGTFWYSGHSVGVKDNVQVCAADATDTYAWRVLY